MRISERQRLESMYAIARALHDQALNVQSILQTVLSMTGQAIRARHGCVMTFDSANAIQNAYILGGTSDPEAEQQWWSQLIDHGLVGFVQHGKRTIHVRNLATDPRWSVLAEDRLGMSTGSAMGLPLEKDGKLYGVMILVHEQVDYFDQEITDMLEAIANMSSAALGNANKLHNARAGVARYQWLFEGSVVPIILTDLEGQIVDANQQACQFLKYSHDKIVQMPITMVHRMGTGPIGTTRFELLKAGQEVEFRTTAWTADSKDIPVSVRARLLTFPDGDLIEWVEQDASAQFELEQLRADLTAMVYHDLRGPLHTVNSSLSTLGRLLVNNDNQAVLNLIQVGMRSTRQLTRMVESLLDIQRLEAGETVLDHQQTSLHNLLANAAELVQPLASESGQRLRFDLADDLPLATIDGDMIQRVVTNLLENAVKYTPQGGDITLGAKVVAGDLRISVHDSGPGIPPNMQRQIFDKFSRVKYKNAPKGIGLGLAFCRLAVEAHGGRIWVESDSGQGSTFQFTLPLEPVVALATVPSTPLLVMPPE